MRAGVRAGVGPEVGGDAGVALEEAGGGGGEVPVVGVGWEMVAGAAAAVERGGALLGRVEWGGG